MIKSRDYYFTEREYVPEKYKCNEKLYKYWQKILGNQVISDIKDSYELSLDTILNSPSYPIKNKNYSYLKDLRTLYENRLNDIIDKIHFNLNLKSQQLAFDKFFIQFINLGIYVLRKNINNVVDNEIFELSFAKNLLDKLGKVSLSTLMFEMYLCKTKNILKGTNEEEEYTDYNERFLSNKKYIEKLFEIYPCLERLIFESIHNIVINYTNLIQRLNKDHMLIVNEICNGSNFNKILNIQTDISDSHKKGATVCILTLDNGKKVVYKPRSLKIENVYQKFLNYLSKGCKYKMGYFKVIDCKQYGWEEFISYRTCYKKEEIRRYYYRFGVLIFCNYILNTNDLHEENLVAAGEYPIIIDAETILDNKKKRNFNTSREAINNILHESVLYSGLLPHYRFSNKGKGLDMSAINGKEGNKYPIVIPKIVNLCTSGMHFEYEHPVTHSNKNLATLNHKFISSSKFINDIDSGFRDAYLYTLRNKDKTLRFINIFENINVRHLIQDTQRYAMIIHTSVHPDFMQDGKDRQLFLCSIFNNVKEVQGSLDIAKMEIEDMLHMDIPYFYLNTSSKSLFGFEKRELKNYFSNTSIDHLKEKIISLKYDDMERQSMFIKIILTNVNNFHVNEKKITFHQIKYINSKASMLKASDTIAKTLIKTAIFNDKKDDINWIGVTLIGDEDNYAWDIRPLGTYLYEGLSGIAIFFNALQKLNPQNVYENVCTSLMNELFSYTDEMCDRTENLENESSGAFGGESSLMYTYEILYKITNNEDYLKYAEKHFHIISKAIISDKSFDIIYGNSGAIITLINMYRLTNDTKYLNVAKQAGMLLVNNQEMDDKSKGGWKNDGRKFPLAGFSHGASGIILALIRLWNATNDFIFLDSAMKGIKFENTLFVKKYGNWKDERFYSGKKASDKGIYTVAWCHGAAGILLSRVKIYKYLLEDKKDKIFDDIKIASKTIISRGILANNCLCHGNLGNTEILSEYTSIFNDQDTKDFCKKVRQLIAENICNGKFDCDNAFLYGYKLQGFMTGLSGMGYSLLRDLDDKLPCILSLDV